MAKPAFAPWGPFCICQIQCAPRAPRRSAAGQGGGRAFGMERHGQRCPHGILGRAARVGLYAAGHIQRQHKALRAVNLLCGQACVGPELAVKPCAGHGIHHGLRRGKKKPVLPHRPLPARRWEAPASACAGNWCGPRPAQWARRPQDKGAHSSRLRTICAPPQSHRRRCCLCRTPRPPCAGPATAQAKCAPQPCPAFSIISS